MRLVGKDVDKLNNARLGFKGAADNSYLNSAKSTMENIYEYNYGLLSIFRSKCFLLEAVLKLKQESQEK